MNNDGDSTLHYKKSVISSYVRRAIKTCSSWELMNKELKSVKQMLIINNYSNTMVYQQINEILNKKINKTPSTQEHQLKIYYDSQYHEYYRTEEKVLKEILERGIITC